MLTNENAANVIEGNNIKIFAVGQQSVSNTAIEKTTLHSSFLYNRKTMFLRRYYIDLRRTLWAKECTCIQYRFGKRR